ncbi:hypothetical protein ACV3UL_15575 [Clostridium perfringens]
MNVIDLKSSIKKDKPNAKFVKDSIRTERVNSRTGEIVVENVVLIMLKNTETNVSIPHPLTEFLDKWKHYAYSTVERRAKEIVPFLNYILIDNFNLYGLSSLRDITFKHGEDFLNEVSPNVKKETLIRYESTLTEFYYFLAKKNILNDVDIDDFTVFKKLVDGKVKESIASPFDNIIYNRNSRKSNLLHHIPTELIIPFLDTAIRNKPQIALGVYFQMFGGLRSGEVVNLTRESITCKGAYGINGMVLDVKKRDLRPDLPSNEDKGEVKKERFQVVLPVSGITDELFKSHLQHIGYNKETGALFLTNEGLGMTVSNYRRYFNDLKKIFIQKLRDSGNSTLEGYALSLSSKKWSTHIGRGIFSNMVADVADNATQIALARGDDNLDSAITYLSDCSTLTKKVESNLNSMYRDLLK